MLARAADAARHVRALRERCVALGIAAPESWLDADSKRLAVGKVVELLEGQKAAARQTEEAIRREVESRVRAFRMQQESAGKAASTEQSRMAQQVGVLAATCDEQAAEIARLEGLLKAAQVPYDRRPAAGTAGTQAPYFVAPAAPVLSSQPAFSHGGVQKALLARF